ncbi:membrane protein insertase YidC [Roseisolibacter agri]|uniref:Membrane protein insertase YidC n=1 Tax=Roseisolibacter agri TaxID=2014610 RepID=A0AA37Q7S7_9BACT|nr:membrane protein insertase YidC [Roseisolibacter agri]GLC24571.1 membrane protein insertase YidC [Roseisolibacter agri]
MENNRRLLLAIALTVLVIVATQFLFPTPPAPAKRPGATADSIAAAQPGQPAPAGAAATPAPGAPGAPGVPAVAGVAGDTTAAGTPAVGAATPALPVETALVAGSRAAYAVSSAGGALVGAEMRNYQTLAPGTQGSAQLARRGEPLLSYRLVVPGDTIALARTPMRATRAGGTVQLQGTATSRLGQSIPVSITYGFAPDNYTLQVRGTAGVTGPAFLLVDMPATIAPTEKDTLDHYNHLAYAWKPQNDDASSVAFGKLDPGERELIAGPLTWAVAKSKYFILGVLAPNGQQFSELSITGGVRGAKVATHAQGTVVVPLTNGGFAFDGYAGPQEWRRLVAMGREFETSNPYGGWLQGIVQPFATIVIRLILWMHDALRLSYGAVLIALGVLVRLLLWPLQQNAMRSQIRMQRVQPELQAIQQKYKNDPQRLQVEMMRVYKEHDVSPFAMLTGCLPMLLPMPIFFALFFVFQNTIEFRGVEWFYLPDLSLKDPYYIMPVLVAGTSFLLSWIGMRAAPPNPQTQMITYMMPAMFLFFFLNVASGLNLYYLVQNLVALPQQWLLARERSKSAPPLVQGTPLKRA